VAILDETGELKIMKHRGKVAVTGQAVNEAKINGTVGIAHTRWATHGEPSDRNAHRTRIATT